MQIILNEDTRRSVVEKAVSVLKKGGIVVYPSDTVYGIAVDATNGSAIQELSNLKKRRPDQKYSYNFSDVGMVDAFCNLDKKKLDILKKYLPGSYTFIIDEGTSVRIPEGTIITEVVKGFGKPVTATSANVTGKLPATSIKNLDAKIYLAADLIIEDPNFEPKQPSTIVDISANPPKVVRAGELPYP